MDGGVHAADALDRRRARLHWLLGERKPRMTYRPADFADYVLMTAITVGILLVAYGPTSAMGMAGAAIGLALAAMFPLRHGFALAWPLLFRRPAELAYLLIYKIRNMPGVYFVALAVLAAENAFIALTPHWPHHVEWMRTIGFALLYLHFLGILAFRTVILVDHLRKREHVRSFLLETPWRSAIQRQPNMVLQIVHAYLTGVLTHMVLLAPWYLVISWADFSVLALPAVLIVNALTQFRYLKVHNEWFYRDHWLGHNSEFEFIYLHGTHHDAIPTGLIGVAGNGHLEGVVRHVMAFPTQFFSPPAAFFFFSSIVIQDILAHQYVPGVFPRLPKDFHEIAQHSTHHLGRLEPYSFGLLFDQPGVPEEDKRGTPMLPTELRNSIRMDQELNGFEWNNRTYLKYRELVDRFDT